MSSDDGIFIQQTRDGLWAAQWSTMSADFPPDPEMVPLDKRFKTLEEAIVKNIENAHDTEYGFQFPTLTTDGFSVTRHHSMNEPLFTFEGVSNA